MSTLTRLFAVVAILIGATAIMLWLYAHALSGNGSWGSKGTPDPTRYRGELVRVIRHGPFAIEQRQYGAGKGATDTEFCDYWITFNSMPVQIDPLGMQNYYNSCNALLLLIAPESTIVLGSHASSGGPYLPIFISTLNGHLVIERREECALHSGSDEYEQSWKGWNVANNRVTLCGQDWQVLPSS